MLKKVKIVSILTALGIVFGVIGCKQTVVVVPVENSETNIVIPYEITDIKVECKNATINLTWTDVTRSDIYGYEISWTDPTDSNRVARKTMENNSVIVSPGIQKYSISGLTPDVEYTFVIKVIDKNLNKSKGVSVSQKYKDTENIIFIKLTYPNNFPNDLSNTFITVTAQVDTVDKVKSITTYMNGSTVNLTPTAYDDKTFTFIVTENGSYTVNVMDALGRYTSNSINVQGFYRDPPGKVTNETKVYDKNTGTLTLTWKDPIDPTDKGNKFKPFDHVLVSYISNDGVSDSEESEHVFVSKGTEKYTFTDIDSTKDYYLFKIRSVDTLGNISYPKLVKLFLKEIIPQGFVKVEGATVEGAVADSSIFVDGGSVTIKDFIMCDHEVTQAEYMELCDFKYCRDGGPIEMYGKGENLPAYLVDYYNAIIYCNKLSLKEGLTPCYTIDDNTNYEEDPYLYYKYGDSNIQPYGSITCNYDADGYRLPTEAEWEYAARGGKGLTGTQTTCAGSDTLGDVAWYKVNASSKVHEVKTKQPNTLGLYDMNGNVNEWVWDFYNNDTNYSTKHVYSDYPDGVLRGGSIFSTDSNLSVNSRLDMSHYFSREYYGFRVVRSVVIE